MKQVWIMAVMCLAVFVELHVGMWGMIVPCLALCTFYLTVVFRWQVVALAVVLASAGFDVALGRQGPVTMCMLFPVMVLAMFWRNQGDCQHAVSQVLPGMIAGCLMLGYTILLRFVLVGAWHGGQPTWDLLRYAELILGTVLGLPLVCLCLDAVAAGLSLPRYSDVRQGGELSHDA